jgi:hypothetical protein
MRRLRFNIALTHLEAMALSFMAGFIGALTIVVIIFKTLEP